MSMISPSYRLCSAPLHRQPQHRLAPRLPPPVLQRQAPPVGLGDLAGEGEADAAASGLGGVEGDEEVLGIGEPGALVVDPYRDVGVLAMPGDLHPAAGLERRIA